MRERKTSDQNEFHKWNVSIYNYKVFEQKSNIDVAINETIDEIVDDNVVKKWIVNVIINVKIMNVENDEFSKSI